MSRRWTGHQPRKGNILDAHGFNEAYDTYKGWINGGIDRTSIIENTIVYDQVLDYALLKVSKANNEELPTDFQNSTGGEGAHICLEYGVYQGGWQPGSTLTVTGLREGMLHAEWSCWAYHNPRETLFNPKYSQWRMLWNGNAVATTHNLFGHWQNPYLMADIPVAGGNGTLTIQWLYAGPDPTYDLNADNQFMYGGGNIYLQVVWR